jgi:hypothetical protein
MSEATLASASPHLPLEPDRAVELRRFFAESWRTSLRERLETNNLQRIDGMLDILGGQRTPSSPEPHRQLFAEWQVPDLHHHPWRTDRAHWMAPPLVPSTYKRSAFVRGDWRARYFLRDGHRYEAAWRDHPATAAVFERAPVASEALFSVLAPHTELGVHSDYLNYVATVHLGLVVPEGCGLRCAGVQQTHAEGEALFFESSFEHSAWNRSPHPRVVLLFDVWHPNLTALECRALEWLHPQAMAAIQALAA